MSEIGGGGERQLTFEPADWSVIDFDISPDDDWIAYILYQSSTYDALVKQVKISTGSVFVLAGENDQCSEFDIQWLDASHIAYRIQLDAYVTQHEDITCQPRPGDIPSYGSNTVFDLTTNERIIVPDAVHLSQSPDGRYWLTGSCEYVYECAYEYTLHNRKTGENWRVAEGLGWVRFLSWSPDSQLMVFSNDWEKGGLRPVRLAVVDAVTGNEMWITPEDKYTGLGSWSPDGQTIAAYQCSYREYFLPTDDCNLWLINRNDMTSLKIDFLESADISYLDWTPDGSRLVFALPGFEHNTTNIWSVKLDGTALVRIVYDADDYKIIYPR